ncbi:hypothetical protein [Microbacterium sp. NPDC077057]|uniref:hypothetical protein n=1 Tax=unclassified Microbacterium TaxID=2609290 RepID=UPI003444A44F
MSEPFKALTARRDAARDRFRVGVHRAARTVAQRSTVQLSEIVGVSIVCQCPCEEVGITRRRVGGGFGRRGGASCIAGTGDHRRAGLS